MDIVESHRVAPGAAHAQRVPVVVDDDTRRISGHLHISVERPPRGVVVGQGDQESGRRGRHRAEDLATVDEPTCRIPCGSRGGLGQILIWLADSRSDDNALLYDTLHRATKGCRAALVTTMARYAPTLDHVQHDHEVHVDAERRRCVAASK